MYLQVPSIDFECIPNPGNHSTGPHVDVGGKAPRWSILADLDWHFRVESESKSIGMKTQLFELNEKAMQI